MMSEQELRIWFSLLAGAITFMFMRCSSKPKDDNSPTWRKKS